VVKDMKLEILKRSTIRKIRPRNMKWSFKIETSDYLDIKKLSNINGEKIINMNVDLLFYQKHLLGNLKSIG
jgi:hypothetical protein